MFSREGRSPIVHRHNRDRGRADDRNAGYVGRNDRSGF
jgi:hypothetical protein